MKRLARAALAAALLAAPLAARANGRFPAANYVSVGPGPAFSTLVLRTTFGLVLSRNYGRTWHWVCEEALGSTGMFDPSVAIGFDGRVSAGQPDGIVTARDYCVWTRPPGEPRVQVTDLANDAAGRRIAAAVGPFGLPNGLSISDDGGATWRDGWRMTGFFVETVEVAPSMPSRVYVTGYLRGGIAVLFRSDDGGMTAREMTRDFAGGTDAYIAAVDATNPDVLYVRSNVDRGTYLLKSDDGGANLRRIGQTTGRMLGFAVSDDGQTVWMGSEERAEGILRSVRGGAFARVRAEVSVRCLRYHAGLLYVCGDDAVDGYALAWSRDGGDTVRALMSLRDVEGPVPCAAGTPVADRCNPLWPAQRTTLSTLDAATPPPREFPDDAAVDAAVDVAGDAPGADAGTDATVADSGAPDGAAPDAAPADAGGDTGAATDAPPSDVAMDAPPPIDARDAGVDTGAVAADTGRPADGGGTTCGCRAGGGRARWSAYGVALAALAAVSRRRRRR